MSRPDVPPTARPVTPSVTPSVTPPVASLVPHAGPMCLLETVSEWRDDGISCEALVTDDHPLRVRGRLPATALIEYAAQAMAAHGRLIANTGSASPRPGRLVGLRATELALRWVTDRRLRIEVNQIGGDPANVLYGFEVFGIDDPAHRRRLANGRAIVTLEAA